MLIKPADSNTRLKKYFGADFPGLNGDKNGADWREWIKKQLAVQASPRQIRRLHQQRNESFAAGRQWLSARPGGRLREPNESKNQLRPVLNQIGPALDFRLGILMEQRPGFRYEPINSGSAGREVSEAQQTVAEYYFYVQRAWQIFLDAAYWAQRHGTSFVQVYVDKNAGPSHDNVELITTDDERYSSLAAMGYEMSESGQVIVPIDESGNFATPGTQVRQLHEGDLASRIVLAHETLADPEARTINGPNDAAKWFVFRRAREIKNVRLELGLSEEDLAAESSTDNDEDYDPAGEDGRRTQLGLPQYPSGRALRNREIVWDNMVYLASNKDVLDDGAWLRVVGTKIVEFNDELPGGVIPFARFGDGSPDPQLYPRPTMTDWNGDQTAINAELASLMQSSRMGGARLLAQKNSVIEETFSKVMGSLLEYSGAKPEVMQALRGNPEAMGLMMFLIGQLENKTGWNALARGQVTGGSGSGANSMQDVSGRALLGAKELFERTFGPMVRATAQGATEWAQITVKYAQHIMTTPRMISHVGRPDMATKITREKLGDKAVVYCDPETLMPLPRSLREQLLIEKLNTGQITMATYQERTPYADIRDLNMGETGQWERAKWINTLIEERADEFSSTDPLQLYAPNTGITVLWQDQPEVHKRALSELILNERKPWPVRKLAADRWGIYDQLGRCQLDQTMTMPVPWEVIGAPPDRMITAAPQPMGQPQPTGQVSAQAPTAGTTVAAPTSPTPEMSSSGVPSIAGEQATPLGQFGDVERAAAEQQS